MEINCIEEFNSNNNFRGINFNYDKVNYELNASLYSNALMIFILYNGKISQMYELNLDIEEEQEKNEYNYFCGNDEDNIKDIDIAECILGKRGNEQINFFANFIMTYIKDIILKINSKINKIVLALNLDENLIKNIENNSNNIKEFINIVKDNIEIIFRISKDN